MSEFRFRMRVNLLSFGWANCLVGIISRLNSGDSIASSRCVLYAGQTSKWLKFIHFFFDLPAPLIYLHFDQSLLQQLFLFLVFSYDLINEIRRLFHDSRKRTAMADTIINDNSPRENWVRAAVSACAALLLCKLAFVYIAGCYALTYKWYSTYKRQWRLHCLSMW